MFSLLSFQHSSHGSRTMYQAISYHSISDILTIHHIYKVSNCRICVNKRMNVTAHWNNGFYFTSHILTSITSLSHWMRFHVMNPLMYFSVSQVSIFDGWIHYLYTIEFIVNRIKDMELVWSCLKLYESNYLFEYFIGN